MEQLHVAFEVEDFLFEVVGVCLELLSDSHRHSVLQLCTSHLDCVVILLSLVAESTDKTGQSTYQMDVHADERQADRCRVSVVCALSTVHVVVRRAILVFALVVSEDFERAVSDHLVGVHVYRCSCTTLYHVDREVFMPLSVDNLAASLCHSSGNLVVDNSERVVCLCGSEFHVCCSDNEIRIVTHCLA